MTNLLTKLTASAALALAFAMPAQAQDEQAQDEMTAETVVASVNGQDITLGHMLMVRATLPDQYQQLPDDVLWDGILDQLIQQEALSQDDAARETRRVRTAIENERRSLLAAEVVASIADAAVTDDAVQAAYDEQYASADQGMEYNAAHILVETQEEAQAIAEEAKGGADFAALAREKSTGPSGPNGGDLGWFGAGMMVGEFQTAVEALEPGQVSDPVQTQFGWHVIRLNETRAMAAPPLDEVRGEIASGLQRQAVSDHIDRLVTEAEVTRTDKADIDPAVLSNLDLLED